MSSAPDPLDGFGGNLDAAFDAAPAVPAVQPLTEDEIYAIAVQCTIGGSLHEDKFARAIEAHHGIAAPGSADHG